MSDEAPQEQTVELVQVGWVVLSGAGTQTRRPRCFDLKPSADKYATGVAGRVLPTYMIPEGGHAK